MKINEGFYVWQFSDQFKVMQDTNILQLCSDIVYHGVFVFSIFLLFEISPIQNLPNQNTYTYIAHEQTDSHLFNIE